MKSLDICLVSYNSEKWIEKAIFSLSVASEKISNVNLCLVDNKSKDSSISVAKAALTKHKKSFVSTKIIENQYNLGFGAGCNIGAQGGKSEYIFFCNIDTEISENSLEIMRDEIQNNSLDFGAFEMRQLPYEHPKFYHPISMETEWASGSCLVIRRDVFEKIGGFDESLFMYSEDVDISYNLRIMGYRIKYVPKSTIKHYAYNFANEQKSQQIIGSFLGNLYLRYKYGNKKDIKDWDLLYEDFCNTPSLNENSKSAILQINSQEKEIRKKGKKARTLYKEIVFSSGFKPNWNNLEYAFARQGAFFETKTLQSMPTFSVLVRTYKRPEYLENVLQNLCNQTYCNFEVIVVEDGESPQCYGIVQKFSHILSIQYIALNSDSGRSVAANVAISKAQGEWLNFLDDDDFFFADHLETMGQLIESNRDCKLLILGAIEAKSTSGASHYRIETLTNRSQKDFSIIKQCQNNAFSIQSVAFHKSLPLLYGGLDEELDALEDWDLWIRYASKVNVGIEEKATSLYHIPDSAKKRIERQEIIDSYRSILIDKWKSYSLNLSASDLLRDSWNIKDHNTYIISQKHYMELQNAVDSLQQSRRWKATKIIRVLPHMLFYGLKKIIKLFGPEDVETSNEAPHALVLQISEIRSSISWRLFNKARRK